MDNDDWVTRLAELREAGMPCVLITVMGERGSVPRGGGSKMIITAEQSWLTIGGGQLEFRCMEIAREMLQQGESHPRYEQFSLGARFAQCCGGAVSVFFEPLWNTRPQIVVFGAGHVGRALITLLATLPCQLVWADSRAQYLQQAPQGVRCCCEEELTDVVASAAPGSYFVVMTHNHDLDLQLAEQVLRRGDCRYLGVIGSQTKRQRFRYRLEGKGISSGQLETLRCPAGIAEVSGKLPAEIAVSIAGEIIAEYQKDRC